MVNIRNTAYKQVLSFVRQDDTSRVFCILNLSPTEQTVTFGPGPHHGHWRDHGTGETFDVAADTTMTLGPWAYRILVGA